MLPVWLLTAGGAFAQTSGYTPPPPSTTGGTSTGGTSTGGTSTGGTSTGGTSTGGYTAGYSSTSTGGYSTGSATTGTTTGSRTTGTTTGSGTTGTTTGATASGTTSGGTTSGTTTSSAGGGFSMNVIWSPDHTRTPYMETKASSSGPVGGHCIVRMSFPTPDFFASGALDSLVVHEDNPLPGCSYDANTTPQGGALLKDGSSVYVNTSDWNTTGMHNGSYTLTAKLHYSTGGYGCPNPSAYTLQQSITVDIENDLIIRTGVNTTLKDTMAAPPAMMNIGSDNPTPIYWDPETMNSVTITAAITAAYTASSVVRAIVYSADQGPVRTMDKSQAVGGNYPAATVVPLIWDGMGEGVSPGVQPKGIYLYQLSVVGQEGDYDQDKSSFLTIPRAEVAWSSYNPTVDQNNFIDSCILTDPVGTPAASTSVTTYGPNLIQLSGPTTMGTLTNLPDAQPALWNATEVTPQTANGWGLYTHLFSALDDHANKDKGHRQRWALQNRALAGTVDLVPYYINKDNPANSAFEFLGTRIVYGGSEPSTSDVLAIQAVVTDLGSGSPSYTWSVTGPGSEAYTPPPPAAGTSVWNLGSIHAVPGALRITCLVRWPGGYNVSQYIDVEVGIRTDDTLCIGWINPSLITLGPADWDIQLEMPPDGPSTPGFQPELVAARLALLSVPSDLWFAGLSDEGVLPQADKDYILNWLFKYAANPDPRPGFLGNLANLSPDASEEFATDLAKFESDPSNYKLLNHFQVKYRVADGHFNGSPVVLRNEAKIGSTHPPLGGIAAQALLPGQPGPNNGKVLIDPDNVRVSLVNDGSPASEGLRPLIALEGMDPAHRMFWEDIGSKITFRCTHTTPDFIFQPYPSYEMYANGRPVFRQDQNESILANFYPNPYPFGTAPTSVGIYTIPGGRNGDAGSPAEPDARVPPFIQP